MSKHTICCPQCEQITKVDEDSLKIWCGFCQNFIVFKENQKVKIICNCGGTLLVPFQLQGKNVRCPSCKDIVSIPFLPITKDKKAIEEVSPDTQKKMKIGFRNQIFLMVPKNLVKNKEGIQDINEATGIQNFKVQDNPLLSENYYDVPLFSCETDIETNLQSLSLFSPKKMLGQWWTPVKESTSKTYIGIDSPESLNDIEKIKEYISAAEHHALTGLDTSVNEAMKLFWNKNTKEKRVPQREDASITAILQALPMQQEEVLSVVDNDLSEGTIIRLVNQILITAFREGVSDIHIEMTEKQNNETETMVRFRIDGVCQQYRKLPQMTHNPIISRLKIMADLDITNHRTPQYGKIQFDKFGQENFRVRLTTMPTVGGHEEAILRILPNQETFSIQQIGMLPSTLEKYKTSIHAKHGLVLISGPTGSGKTTTLHSSLHILKNETIKILTVEDPVEITQPGISQVQVNAKTGLTFASALRGFLRADPDIIMVGEIRDEETAVIATQAALTGHLVFSTLHTNNTYEALVRMLDLGINSYNFSDALRCIVAQRLARKLCLRCKKKVEGTEKEKIISFLKEEYANEFNCQYEIAYNQEIDVYQSSSCDSCREGYRGRIAIHELLVASEKIKAAIRDKEPSAKIREVAMREGMLTLNQDGIIKVLSGFIDVRQMKLIGHQE